MKKPSPIRSDLHAGRISRPTSGSKVIKTSEKRLFLKVSATNCRSWLFICRVHGQQQRMVLGQYPEMTFHQAQTKTRQLGSMAASGKSPRDELKQDQQGSITVNTVLEEFDRRHLSKLSRPDTPRGRIKKWIKPTLGKKILGTVTKQHFIQLANQIEDTGAKQEHFKILKLCRQIWEFAIGHSYLDSSPVPKMKATNKPRKRFLSGKEISQLWKDVCRTDTDRLCPYNGQHSMAWKLIVLTGQRISSLLQARVEHFDLEEGLWVIPAELMKAEDGQTGQPHTVHLSKSAVELARKAIANHKKGFLFTGIRSKNKPVSASWFTTKHTEWLKAMGIEHATIHDYRRALSTHGAELGIKPHIIEKILAHQMTGVMAVYNRAQYLEGRKRALIAYSDWITGITAGGGQVVPIRQSAG